MFLHTRRLTTSRYTCPAHAWRMRSSWRCSGKRPAALHAGVILVNLASAMLVFVLARRIYGDAAGVAAAGTYALLSIVPETVGLAAHATHFVMLPALAGASCCKPWTTTRRRRGFFPPGCRLACGFDKITACGLRTFCGRLEFMARLSGVNNRGGDMAPGWLAGLGGVLPFIPDASHHRLRRRRSSILAVDI